MENQTRHLDEEWVKFREDHWREGLYLYVSNYGNVKRQDLRGNWSLAKTFPVSGFPSIRMNYVKNKGKTFYIHRLVAKAFLKNEDPENLTCVTHLDFIKDNNHVSNLKWITRKEQHRIKHLSPNFKGKKFFNSHNHTEEQIRLIKKKLLNPNRKAKVKTIAKQFGYSEKQARRIMRCESWAEIKID